jgi:hypothetical protein
MQPTNQDIRGGVTGDVVILRFHIASIPGAFLLRQDPDRLRELIRTWPHVVHSRMLTSNADLLKDTGSKPPSEELRRFGKTILTETLINGIGSRKPVPKAIQRLMVLCEGPVAPVVERFDDDLSDQYSSFSLEVAVKRRHQLSALSLSRALALYVASTGSVLWTNVLERAVIPLALWQPTMANVIFDSMVVLGAPSLPSAPISGYEVAGSQIPPDGIYHDVWDSVNETGAFFSSGDDMSVSSYIVALPGLTTYNTAKGLLHSPLHLLKDHAQHSDDPTLFRSKLMKSVVSFKWRAYARRRFLRQLLLYIGFLLSTTISFVCFAYHGKHSRKPLADYDLFSFAEYGSTGYGIAGWAFAVPALLLELFVFLPNEYLEHRSSGSSLVASMRLNSVVC